MTDLDNSLREIIRRVVREELAVAQETARAAALGEWISTRQAAELVNVAQGTIRRWVREGRIESGGAGRELRVRREDLEALLSAGPTPRRARGFQQSPEALAQAELAKMFGQK